MHTHWKISKPAAQKPITCKPLNKNKTKITPGLEPIYKYHAQNIISRLRLVKHQTNTIRHVISAAQHKYNVRALYIMCKSRRGTAKNKAKYIPQLKIWAHTTNKLNRRLIFNTLKATNLRGINQKIIFLPTLIKTKRELDLNLVERAKYNEELLLKIPTTRLKLDQCEINFIVLLLKLFIYLDIKETIITPYTHTEQNTHLAAILNSYCPQTNVFILIASKIKKDTPTPINFNY